MKTFLFAAAGALALGFSGAAFADDHEGEAELSENAKQFEQGCLSYKAEHGTEADCTCLAETFDKDEEFATEMMSVMTPEDIPTLSEATLEKIVACEPADEEM